MKRYGRPSRYGALLLGSLLLCSTAAVWAANPFALRKVGFVSSERGLEILLHTGSIVPVHTVLTSKHKLVIDIDNVNADATVQTDFEGAWNVSHVILQPLSKERLRLIVRGDDLNAPAIRFKDSGIPTQTFAYKGSAETAPPAEEAFSASAIADEAPGDEGRLATQDLKAFADQNTHAATLQDAKGFQAGHTATLPATNPPAESGEGFAPLALAGNDASAAAPTGIGEALGNWDFFGQGTGWFLKLGLLGGLILTFGLFLYRKYQTLTQERPAAADEVLAASFPPGGARFDALAKAYQQHKAPEPRRGKATAGETPIGLGGLKPQANRAPAKLQPGLPPVGRKPAASAAPQAALNQYLQQSQKPLPAANRGGSTPAKRPAVGSSAPRATAAAPVKNPPPPAKRPTGIIPENQEVLDFLRSVAEHMEKDGNAEAARRIQRTIVTR